MKQALAIILGLVATGFGIALVVYVLFTGPGDVPPSEIDFAALDPERHAELVDAGEYVAKAADCAACHESDDGLALAGGTPMETPMGTIYGTNITPSQDNGIGDYTPDDLYRAMVYGIAPGGRHLYPAMPYTSYHAMSRADVDALYAYLMDQEPVARPNKVPELVPPFNARPLLAFWNLVFRPAPPSDPSSLTGEGVADGIERGAYLVDVLGHCGECHTPRNIAFAKTDDHLGGEVIEGALAPDLSPGALARRGWTRPDLVQFLQTGLSPQGVMTFRMFPVLSHSTKYLSGEDIKVIVAYLAQDMPTPSPPTEDSDAAAEYPQGHELYLGLCAGCHGPDGTGQPYGSVPMEGNTTLMLENDLNLRRIISEGIPARHLSGYLRMQEMPAFGATLSDAEMTDLTNYLRARWGGP